MVETAKLASFSMILNRIDDKIVDMTTKSFDKRPIFRYLVVS